MLSARTLRVAPRALRLAAAAPQLRRLCTEVAEVTPQAKAIGQLEERKARLATEPAIYEKAKLEADLEAGSVDTELLDASFEFSDDFKKARRATAPRRSSAARARAVPWARAPPFPPRSCPARARRRADRAPPPVVSQAARKLLKEIKENQTPAAAAAEVDWAMWSEKLDDPELVAKVKAAYEDHLGDLEANMKPLMEEEKAEQIAEMKAKFAPLVRARPRPPSRPARARRAAPRRAAPPLRRARALSLCSTRR